MSEEEEEYMVPTPSKRLPKILFSCSPVSFPPSIKQDKSALFEDKINSSDFPRFGADLEEESDKENAFPLCNLYGSVTPDLFMRTPKEVKSRNAQVSSGVKASLLSSFLDFKTVNDTSKSSKTDFDLSLDSSPTSLKDFLSPDPEDSPEEKSKPVKRKRPKKQHIGSKKERKKRTNEWKESEIIALLQLTKLMLDCELKSVSKALFEVIERNPGKSFGRAAEKKLRRMGIFENWKKTTKETIVSNIDSWLLKFGSNGEQVPLSPLIESVAKRYRQIEIRSREN